MPDTPPAQEGKVAIRVGATRSIEVGVGSMVLVREGANNAYGAVIRRITGASAALTFTPKDMPRSVPLGMILCAADSTPATIDPSSVPRYQPEPSEKPRRRKDRG